MADPVFPDTHRVCDVTPVVCPIGKTGGGVDSRRISIAYRSIAVKCRRARIPRSSNVERGKASRA